MNLPADDHPGQGADSPAVERDGVDPAGASSAPAGATPAETAAGAAARAAATQRTATRRILDEVFGDVLPSVTRDELDDGSERSNTGRDQWYRDNRPPHHG
jgi:hypothetical protein